MIHKVLHPRDYIIIKYRINPPDIIVSYLLVSGLKVTPVGAGAGGVVWHQYKWMVALRCITIPELDMRFVSRLCVENKNFATVAWI